MLYVNMSKILIQLQSLLGQIRQLISEKETLQRKIIELEILLAQEREFHEQVIVLLNNIN